MDSCDLSRQLEERIILCCDLLEVGVNCQPPQSYVFSSTAAFGDAANTFVVANPQHIPPKVE